MAYTTTPIAFSGTASNGALQIKPADIYVGTLVNGAASGMVYIGYSNQQLALTINQTETDYMQNGVPVETVPISKDAQAKFRLDEWDTKHLAFALGLDKYLADSAASKERVAISADNVTPKEWYIRFVTETVDGKPVQFDIPRGQVKVDGDIVFGGGNESPSFNGISVNVKALAADVKLDGSTDTKVLAFYEKG